MVKKLGSLISKQEEFIHAPFTGEMIREKDAVTAKIKTSKGWLPAKPWRYSPFGIEIINSPDFGLKQGESVSIKINLAGDETDFNGLTVNALYKEDEVVLAGIRTFIPKDNNYNPGADVERRTHRRWNCSENFLPTGTAPNPVRYNDFVLFRVEDISAGGMRLITSMRNKFLGIGQRLEANISLPFVGIVQAKIQVRYVHTVMLNNKEFLVVGTSFLNTDAILMQSLGEYLLNFAKDITAKSLNHEGFNIKAISKWLDFSYVKNETEYKDVLALRYIAYKSANKISSEKTIEDMADELDARSRILIAKYNGKIVGSMRIVFPSKKEDLELQHSINYPEHFPSMNEIVETSRFCTDPEFRGTDIAFELVAQMVLSTVMSGRRYLYTAATDELWLNICKKIGWQLTGIKFQEKFFFGLPHELMLMDTHDVAVGKGVNFKYWNRVYKKLAEYLISKDIITPSSVDKVRINIYKRLGEYLA